MAWKEGQPKNEALVRIWPFKIHVHCTSYMIVYTYIHSLTAAVYMYINILLNCKLSVDALCSVMIAWL